MPQLPAPSCSLNGVRTSKHCGKRCRQNTFQGIGIVLPERIRLIAVDIKHTEQPAPAV